MSVRFDAATDQLALASAPTSSTPLTITAWVRNIEAVGNGTFLRLRAAGTIASFTASSGGTNGPQLATTGGTAGPIVVTGGSLPTNGWRRVMAVINGVGANNCTVYWGDDNPATDLTAAVGSVATGAPTALSVGGRGGGDTSERWGGDMAYPRMWTAALTPTEGKAELASTVPVRTADLWADWPLLTHTDLTDHSGNGRHLTAGATATTTQDNPPISAGATLGTATGTSTAQAVTGAKTAALGVAVGGGSAQALTGQKLATLGVTVGASTAMALAGAKTGSVAPATSTGSALALSGNKVATLGVVTGVSSAMPLGDQGSDITLAVTLEPRGRHLATLGARRAVATLEAQP